MRAKFAIVLAALVATSCRNAAEQEVNKYDIVANGTDNAAKCDQGKRVASAYLNRQDQENYEKWKLRSDIDCNAADLDRAMPSEEPDTLDTLPDNTTS